MKFHKPPHLKNEDGALRKAGFEIEFNGIDIAEIAAVLWNLLGGSVVQKSSFEYQLRETGWGDFTIELDAVLLKDKKYETYLKKLGIEPERLLDPATLEEALIKIATTVVPYEIVTPPLPIDRLDILDDLRAELQKRKAQGSKSSLLHAFGLHINPEAPARDAGTLLNFLRAFLLLYEWICRETEIDLSRRVTPFINEFPDDYTRLILDPDYDPDLQQLIGDYIEHNPTRNRPLDLLPLFASIDPKPLEGLEEELLKPRPAFHYRLPNCLIDDPEWRIAREWNYWIEIERLADQPEKLREMSEHYRKIKDTALLPFQNRWPEEVSGWL